MFCRSFLRFPGTFIVDCRSIKKLAQVILIITCFHLSSAHPDKMFQLIHVLLLCDAALRHLIQSLFPACCKLRIEKLPDGAVYHIKDHLSQKRGSDHLGLFVQRQILDIK